MIPHMTLCVLFLPIDPASDVRLPAARDTERTWRDVFRDRRASGDVGALADPHGGNELRVAADEGVLVDDRLVLRLAVVVAGDRACSDVDVGADGGISEVRQMTRLRFGPERRLLQFDKVAYLGALADERSWAKVGKRADTGSLCNF